MLVKVRTAHGDLYINPERIGSLLVYPTRLSKLVLADSDATWSLDEAETARLLAALPQEAQPSPFAPLWFTPRQRALLEAAVAVAMESDESRLLMAATREELLELRDEVVKFVAAAARGTLVAYGAPYGRRDLKEYTALDAMRDELAPPHLVQQAAELGEFVADIAERLKRLLAEIEAAKRAKEGT